jgi:hypothetical protein
MNRNGAFIRGDNWSFALPQSLLRRFTREILLLSGPDRAVVVSLPLEWVFVQFEGVFGLGCPRAGASFMGVPHLRGEQ